LIDQLEFALTILNFIGFYFNFDNSLEATCDLSGIDLTRSVLFSAAERENRFLCTTSLSTLKVILVEGSLVRKNILLFLKFIVVESTVVFALGFGVLVPTQTKEKCNMWNIALTVNVKGLVMFVLGLDSVGQRRAFLGSLSTLVFRITLGLIRLNLLLLKKVLL
jgi:hypothetical protein